MKKYKLIKTFPGVTEGILNEIFNSISTEDGNLIRFYDYLLINADQWPEFFEEIKEPLFITEDGEEYFNEYFDNLYVVHEDDYKCLQANCYYKRDSLKYFSTKEAAEKWIQENKPIYSKSEAILKKDILKVIERIKWFFDESEDFVCEERVLKNGLGL